jgi:hypothetical protein
MISIWCLAGTRWTDRLVRRVEAEEPGTAPEPLATHVATERDGLLIEAVFPRVRRSVGTIYDGMDVRRYPLVLTPEQEEAIWQDLLMHVGEWYDLLGVVKAYLYCTTGHTQRWLEDDDARVQCAALPVDVLREHDFPILAQLPPSNCTPRDVDGWLITKSWLEAKHHG